MEKYARQALSEGAKSETELHVSEDSELYRVLNVHYNRNNHIEVRYTVPIRAKMFYLLANGLAYRVPVYYSCFLCLSHCYCASIFPIYIGEGFKMS